MPRWWLRTEPLPLFFTWLFCMNYGNLIGTAFHSSLTRSLRQRFLESHSCVSCTTSGPPLNFLECGATHQWARGRTSFFEVPANGISNLLRARFAAAMSLLIYVLWLTGHDPPLHFLIWCDLPVSHWWEQLLSTNRWQLWPCMGAFCRLYELTEVCIVAHWWATLKCCVWHDPPESH